MERGLLQGLAAFRWAAWGWAALVLALKRDAVERPLLGAALLAAALAYTAYATGLLRDRWERLLAWPVVAAELALGVTLTVVDGILRQGQATGQQLGSVWPLVGVMAAGAATGPAGGVAAGLLLGAGRVAAELLTGIEPADQGREVLALLATTFTYCLVGAVVGQVVRLLRRAEQEVAMARAREEVARELHDGVLQTLALVERRVGDPGLARLAREQERDLRAYLFGDRVAGATDLGARLRHAADRYERSFGGRVQVLVAGDLPPLPAAAVDALAGAVGEALANAGKHGPAPSVTVFAEPDEGGGVFCSVRDDGAGFDPAAVVEGVGLSGSVRGRMEAVGGRVEVRSEPGRGTEVLLWSSR